MPKDFNKIQNSRPSEVKPVRIILTDIMDCYVRVVRLSDAEIERASNRIIDDDDNDSNHHNSRRNSMASYHSDHTYSKLSLPQEPVHTSPLDATNCSKTPVIESDLSPDTSSDASFNTCQDTVESDADCTAISGLLSLSTSNISWTESGDSDDSDVENDDTEAYPPINLEAIDNTESPQNSVEHSNGFVIANSTNGLNSHIELNHMNGSLHSNGMKSQSNSNVSSPTVAFNDEDDDLRFLYGLKEELDQTANENGIRGNCDENGEIWPSIWIFGNVCMKFLTDICFNPYCEHSHELPSIETVQSHLNTASSREIWELHKHILLRYDKLMVDFFETFCSFCGRKWQYHRENLRTMIEPLSTRPSAAAYMKHIVNGFLISDMRYSTCVNLLMLQIDSSLNMDDRFNILWGCIIDPRNDKIDEHLKSYEIVFMGNAIGIVDAMNKLMKYHIVGGLDQLREFTVNLVKKCRIDTFRRLDSKLLKGFIEYVRSFDLNSKTTIEKRAIQFNFTDHELN